MNRVIDGAFVQIGAARDGMDPYLDCARERGMTTVLVETPAYLRWRRHQGRRPFDLEVPVSEPEDPGRLAAALKAFGGVPALVLAGFDRYAVGAFALAAELRVAPWPRSGADFVPPDKYRQRSALARHAPHVLQPRHVRLTSPDGAGPTRELTALAFPQVVKPVDGGGGLGVYLVADAAARERAARRVAGLANYGGAAFTGLMVEEHVRGTEFSMQGIAWEGEAHLLSFCEKVITSEADPDGLRGFREAGHIAAPGALTPPALRELARSCVRATGYRRGPFHVDAISNGRGPFFLEMGFRLSGGGLVALVERATGMRWAELAFAALLDDQRPPEPTPGSGRRPVGQLVVTGQRQLVLARTLAAAHPGVRINLAVPPPAAEGLRPEDATVLAADRGRNGAVRARVLLEHPRTEQIRSWLHHCAGAGPDA